MDPNLKIQTKPNQTPGQYETVTVKQTSYAESINFSTGWFQPKLLSAIKVESQQVQPIGALRYNPTVDDGKNNSVWFSSVLTETYERPRTDTSLIIYGKSLYRYKPCANPIICQLFGLQYVGPKKEKTQSG